MKYLKFLLLCASFLSFSPIKLVGMVEFNQQTIEGKKKQKTPLIEKWLYQQIVKKQAKQKASSNADTFGKWAFWLGIAGLFALVGGTVLFFFLLKSLEGLTISFLFAFIAGIIALKFGNKAGKDSKIGKKGKSVAYLVLTISFIPLLLMLVILFGVLSF